MENKMKSIEKKTALLILIQALLDVWEKSSAQHISSLQKPMNREIPIRFCTCREKTDNT